MSAALTTLFEGWLATAAVDLALLFGLLLSVDLLLGERLGPRVRYLLWSLLLVRMLLPSLLPDPLGWKSASTAPPALVSAPPTASHLALPPPVQRPRERAPSPDVSALSESSFLQARGEPSPRAATRPAALPLAEAIGSDTPRPIVAGPRGQWPAVLAWLWAIGAALLLLRLATLEFRFRRALQSTARPAPASVQKTLDAARSRLGLRRAVVALVTEAVPAPAVYGVLRPRLLLPPATLARLSDTELAHVVGHEVAHLRAGDTLLCWLLAIARALHWYHPAAWIGLRRLQAAQEVLRDYQALGKEPGVDPGGYAATVLKLGAPPPARPLPAPLPAILEDGRDLKRRIQMIVDFPARRRGATLLGTCLLAAVGWVGLTTAASVASPAGGANLQEAQYKSVRVVRQEPVPEWKTELLARLQKPVDIDVDAASLEDVLDVLREKARVNVVVDPDAADMASPLDLQANGRSAAQILDLVCGENLDWGLAPGVVMIGWESDDLQRHDLRFYAVEELVAGDDPEWRAERLQDLLRELSWRNWETEYASMRYWNGLLIVRQTDRGHERVATLLDMLLNRGRHAPESAPVWRAELDAKLDVVTAVDFDEQGFAAVVRALSEHTEVPMYVHPDVAMDQMVTLRLDGLPLREVLDWIGRQTWTHAVIEDGMVRFVDEPPTEVRMYDIADLLRLQGADPDWAAEQVMELVQDGTGWAAWEIEDARLEMWDGMLVVVQSADTHTRVARFLEALREAL